MFVCSCASQLSCSAHLSRFPRLFQEGRNERGRESQGETIFARYSTALALGLGTFCKLFTSQANPGVATEEGAAEEGASGYGVVAEY